MNVAELKRKNIKKTGRLTKKENIWDQIVKQKLVK